MKIKSFRIRNYRSIIDSGICYLSGDNLTILAGKNESGKTSILEALEYFGIDKLMRDDAIPLHVENAKPEITITFEVSNDTLNEFINEIGLKYSTTTKAEIAITKNHLGIYSISLEAIAELGLQDCILSKINTNFKMLVEILEKIPQAPPCTEAFSFINLNDDNIEQTKLELTNYNILQNELGDYSDEEMHEFIQKRDELIEYINEYIKLGDNIYISPYDVRQWIPNFILFSSFDNLLPSEIMLADASNNELIKDLSIISDLDLDLIISGKPAAKTKHKEKLNIRLKDDYKEYWTQDLTNLHVDWESDRLFFFIKENDNFFPPNIRSKGKQWHLAFYFKISARSKEDIPNVILIDEPGLYLHATAQQDIVKKLEDSASDVPIIFSSHSPYLIDIDKLSRIRLVSRTEETGTIVSNKIHKGADKETLTPIITAIGLDLSLGLDLAKDNNIIVEGMSDYYYLYALKELLNFEFKEDVHFIPTQGADKFKFLIPLMIGWGLNHCVVLDNDKKGRKVEKELQKNFQYSDLSTLFVSDVNDEEIEDLFDEEDFSKYIIGDDIKETLKGMGNSKLLKQKDAGFDKVLLSKLFYENVKKGDVSLSSKTKENFKKLFENINQSMFQEV